MAADTYRYRVNALTMITASAFAGANLFIGASIGPYWLSLDPLEFVAGFASQFQAFLVTVMPLFILTLVGLALSARLDWQERALRRSWLTAIGAYTVISAITMGFHVPENLRLLAADYTSGEADLARTYWLLGHIPRVVLAFLIPIYAHKAIMDRESAHVVQERTV